MATSRRSCRLGLGFIALVIAACSVEPVDQNPDGSDEQTGTARAALGTVRATYLADINGDGRADRISRTNVNEFLVAISTGPGTYGPDHLWMQHGGPFQDAQQAQFVDLNGDGKKDLAYRGTDNSFWMSITNPTGTGFLPVAKWMQHGGGYDADQAHYADLNGDKKMDLIMRGLDNSFWVSITNPTGTGFLPVAKWMKHGGAYAVDQAHYEDFNGDGKADLVMRGLDNAFWVSLTNPTGTGFLAVAKWLQHGGGYAPGQAVYSDLNGDKKVDVTFHGGVSTDWISFSTGATFTVPYPRDPVCGNAPGCLRVNTAGVPARQRIYLEDFEPNCYLCSSSPPTPANLGLIRPGEHIVIEGYLTAEQRDEWSPVVGDLSDYAQFSLTPGVEVNGSVTNNNLATYSCGGSTHHAGPVVTTGSFPWTTPGAAFLRAEWFRDGCMIPGASFFGGYVVELNATKGEIFIRIDGPGGPYFSQASSRTIGVPLGQYTLSSGTDADRNGVLCGSGDFCDQKTVVVASAAMQTVTLIPH